MAALLSPTRLDIHDATTPVKALRESVRQRVDVTPTPLTPEALEADSSRRAQLREAHVNAVKERAARDIQRASDAKARKRRAVAEESRKIKLKMDAATNRTEARKQEQANKRDNDKAHRSALAEGVATARRAADMDALKRGLQFAMRAEAAVEKKENLVASVAQRGGAQVKHALAVVTAQKDKEAAEAAAATEKLRTRLAAAEARRTDALPESDADARQKHAVSRRQAHAFELEKKRVAQQAVMDKAATKRAAILQTISDTAAIFNTHAAEVAETARSIEAGTDAATVKSKASMYSKLNSAEVARAIALRKRCQKTAASGHHPDVIVVPVGNGNSKRTPSKKLLRRLTACSQSLLASSAARQLGAFSRRELRLTEIHTRAVQKVTKIAAAAKRRSLARARRIEEVAAKELRSEAVLQEKELALARLVTKEMALTAMVKCNRLAAEQISIVNGDANDALCEAASERRALHLRKTAKVGVTAVRASAVKFRRNALASIITKNAELNQTRYMKAMTIREAELGSKVAAAKRSAAKRAPEPEAQAIQEPIE